MKKNLLILFINLTFLSIGFAQTNLTPENNNTVSIIPAENVQRKVLYAELENTYHFEYSISNYKVLISLELLESIKQNRKENEDFRLQWDGFTTIVIYAENRISSPSKISKNQ